MKRIINLIEQETKIRPVPLETTKAGQGIVYRYYQTGRFKWRLELRVIDLTFGGVDTVAAAIVEMLHDIGDTCQIEGIRSCVLNGGGTLKDGETKLVQRLLYFDVVKEK